MSSPHAGEGDEQQRRTKEWMERIEKRQGKPGLSYVNMWPIFLAPVIPLIGLTFK